MGMILSHLIAVLSEPLLNLSMGTPYILFQFGRCFPYLFDLAEMSVIAAVIAIFHSVR